MPIIEEADRDGWDDLLGTGTVLKKVLKEGQRQHDSELDFIEAPRKFFALIDIESRCDGRVLAAESHRDYLINCDVDLFPGAHLVIPLMDLGETSCYVFDPKFVYGPRGKAPDIPPNVKLECRITLKQRAPYDQFLEQMTARERLELAHRKRDRGKFWFERNDYESAISLYNSIRDLCLFEEGQPGSTEGGDDIQQSD